jgi:hypothetical protein
MPYLGTLFGLTEEDTSMILVEIGCLSEHQQGTTTIICPQGARLGGPSVGKLLIEFDSTSFKGKSVCAYWKPTGGLQISFADFRKYKSNPKSVVPPTRLGSQVINKFVTTELVGILKSSRLFDKILKATYYDSDMLSKVGRNKRLI